jgi:hypothetical protein
VNFILVDTGKALKYMSADLELLNIFGNTTYEDLCMGYYVHELPGRVRIKMPMLKRNQSAAERLTAFVESMEGVHETSFNSITGSIVIQFDERRLTSKELLQALSKANFIDVSETQNVDEYVADVLTSVGHKASKTLLGFALDRALQGSSLSIITALI